MLRRAAALLTFCLGQTGAQNSAFRSETKVVQVPVSVTGRNGRDVEGLAPRDFKLLDNGVPQDVVVDVFDTGVAPISLAIAIQSAGISTPALKKIRRIGGMIQPLVTGTRGETAVLTFDSEVTWVQDFTHDTGALQSAVRNLRPFKSTEARMYDAIIEAANGMKDHTARKVLLLISESRDRGSKARLEDAMEAVEREGIEVFAAHYSAFATAFASRPEDLQQHLDAPAPRIERPDAPPTTDPLSLISELVRLGKTNAVEALTKATGGSKYPFAKERGIEDAIEKLGVEIHSQYILTFALPVDATGFHKIDVAIPEHPEYKIHARLAYRVDRP
jgi:VWFA-related protein